MTFDLFKLIYYKPHSFAINLSIGSFAASDTVKLLGALDTRETVAMKIPNLGGTFLSLKDFP